MLPHTAETSTTFLGKTCDWIIFKDFDITLMSLFILGMRKYFWEIDFGLSGIRYEFGVRPQTPLKVLCKQVKLGRALLKCAKKVLLE